MDSLSSLIGIITDNSAKLILLKAYSALLGLKATTLLTHLCNSIEQEFRVENKGAFVWHKQNLEWMSYQTTLSKSSLRKARDLLIKEGFLEIKQSASCDRTTLWRIRQKKLTRFYVFSHALRLIDRPNPLWTKWENWAKDNKKLIQEFQHLAPDLFYKEDLSDIPVIKRTKPIPIKASVIADLKRSQRVVEDKKQVKACKYVEHWNSLPHVPKCKIGTKNYEIARKFFRAHKNYQAGFKLFVLTKDEQIRISLHKINMVPKGVKYRTDKQMFKHIELAALSYNPDYGPQKKDWLPRSLSSFLFNAFSKKYGQTSLFLERLYLAKPQPLSEITYEGISDKMTEQEAKAVDIIKRVYYLANNKPRHQELSLTELKQALTITRNIFKQYLRIPVDAIAIFANHFGSIWEFMKWWENYVEDHTWQGMPLIALDPSKNLWRAFTDFVSDDIGYNLFTGKRL